MKRYCILLLITLSCLCSCSQRTQSAEASQNDSITKFFKNFYVGYNDYCSRRANADLAQKNKFYYQAMADDFSSFLKGYCCDDITAEVYMNNNIDIYGQDDINVLNDSIFNSLYVDKVKGEKNVYMAHLQIDTMHIQRLYTLVKHKGKMKIYAIGKRKHPMIFRNDTLQIEDCPNNRKGFYLWHGVTISNYYAVTDSLTLNKNYRVAILTPYFECTTDEPSIYSDRLLLIVYKNLRMVYNNVISNKENLEGWQPYETLVKPTEEKAGDLFGYCDFILSFGAGNGYKVYYTIGIKMTNGKPYVTGIKWEEHDSGLFYRKQIMQRYDDDQIPLSSYSRWMPWELSQE